MVNECGSQVVVAVHPCLWIFEDFPVMPVAVGILAHGLYYKLLATFPFTEMTSPVFIASVGELRSLTAVPFWAVDSLL